MKSKIEMFGSINLYDHCEYCLFSIVTMNNFWLTLTFSKKLMQALHEHVRIDIDIRFLKPNFDGQKKKKHR